MILLHSVLPFAVRDRETRDYVLNETKKSSSRRRPASARPSRPQSTRGVNSRPASARRDGVRGQPSQYTRNLQVGYYII